MDNTLEQSYFSVSRYFDVWVRLMEIQTRRMEVQDSAYFNGTRRLIIAPPTDSGIPLLAKSGKECRTDLLCFSERLKRIAATYFKKHGIKELIDIHVTPFFRLTFSKGELEAIFANCLFDFCQEKDFDLIFDEMHRVLTKNGSLFAVYMDYPQDFLARRWTAAFEQFKSLSQGCHPVSLEPRLSCHGFSISKDLRLCRWGFPLRYTVAKKHG